jgi:hypothetical protein
MNFMTRIDTRPYFTQSERNELFEPSPIRRYIHLVVKAVADALTAITMFANLKPRLSADSDGGHSVKNLTTAVARSVRQPSWFLLAYWRYGTETDQLVAEALDAITGAEQWKKWDRASPSTPSHRAATQVPHYRQYWETDGGVTGFRSNVSRIGLSLAKEMLRRGPVIF